MGLIHVIPVNRRRNGKNPEESRRQSTLIYNVPDGEGNHKRVCKRKFMDIFAISKKKIEILAKKKKSGDTVYHDGRGGAHVYKYLDHDLCQIKEHINSIPRDIGHYSRKMSSKEYLSPDLNINRLYEAFKVKYPESRVHRLYYRRVFLRHFPHLSFRRPRTDTCKKCDLYNLQIKGNTRDSPQAKRLLQLHHMKVEKAVECLKKDSEDSCMPGSDVCTLSVDLQQVMFVPNLTHSDMFYMRQLSCYNYGIHIHDTSDAVMCFWHEGVGGRSANNIASCLFKVLNSVPDITSKKKLIVWSDNCSTQNKNRIMIFLYMFLIGCGVYESIEHKYLVSGHSFLACDRDFAVIEKRAKVKKHFVPDDVMNTITTARNKQPFKVVQMKGSYFMDFQQAADMIINTTKVNISSASWIKITTPGVIQIKKDIW
ncbi:hypothetical protein ANN_26286 [Periplaneta americana]|uniref:DUF7869 domain-containing protein n=1 Tax=Periplaneta americana TaxID=6978 RepID=A0ABQ8S5G7_PERAM|nr:hypothetical protein ANN_26286 [Periplaneta americana]